MKKSIQIAISIVLSIATTSTANAGLFDWIGGKKSETVLAVADHIDSFDELYRDVKNEPKENASAVFGSNAVTGKAGLVVPKTARVKRTYTVEISGYSSTPDQTDDSPFITARGTYVRDGIVAANFLPFGTAVKIPSLYGDKIFIVEDRMNKRYWYNVDVWFPNRQSALNLGRRMVTIEVL